MERITLTPSVPSENQFLPPPSMPKHRPKTRTQNSRRHSGQSTLFHDPDSESPREISGTKWPESDPVDGVWTIPAELIRARLEHQLPLSASALDLSWPQYHRIRNWCFLANTIKHFGHTKMEKTMRRFKGLVSLDAAAVMADSSTETILRLAIHNQVKLMVGIPEKAGLMLAKDSGGSLEVAAPMHRPNLLELQPHQCHDLMLSGSMLIRVSPMGYQYDALNERIGHFVPSECVDKRDQMPTRYSSNPWNLWCITKNGKRSSIEAKTKQVWLQLADVDKIKAIVNNDFKRSQDIGLEELTEKILQAKAVTSPARDKTPNEKTDFTEFARGTLFNEDFHLSKLIILYEGAKRYWGHATEGLTHTYPDEGLEKDKQATDEDTVFNFFRKKKKFSKPLAEAAVAIIRPHYYERRGRPEK